MHIRCKPNTWFSIAHKSPRKSIECCGKVSCTEASCAAYARQHARPRGAHSARMRGRRVWKRRMIICWYFQREYELNATSLSQGIHSRFVHRSSEILGGPFPNTSRCESTLLCHSRLVVPRKWRSVCGCHYDGASSRVCEGLFHDRRGIRSNDAADGHEEAGRAAG